jgi:asparagine synthase (glutamine-hydrolysing)
LAGRAAPPVSFEELRRMVAMLAHRGPDGHGLYRDDHVGLAHARLSLVDLAGGFQPIRNTDGSIWLSFNGEIFNYVELRRHLGELGHRFYTSGDSEVIVHCYERYGADAWRMLNGQFAFALWDAPRRRLWLVRDRLGILPLFYGRAGDHLLFASEAKALFASGRIAPAFSAPGLGEVFTTWSAAAPTTVFAGVLQVPPATALCFDESLDPRPLRYWQPSPEADRLTANLDTISEEEAADRLGALLDSSVALRLRADVPVGAYVSGGLDSSVTSSLAKDQLTIPLDTFGIRFEDRRFDETAEQRLVVGHLGSRHHDILCRDDDIRRALSEVVWHCETPLLRTSPVPLFLLSGLVREIGIKTVLTGEGADELLAGYTIFKEDQIRRFWARQPHSRRRPALLARIHHYVGGADARSTALWQSFFGRDLNATAHPFYSHLIRWQNTAWTLRLLAPEVRAEAAVDRLLDGLAAGMPAGWSSWDPLTRAQWTEISSFMSSFLLACQGDRVAMAHGVEARYPFLDPALVDFCLALPKRHKLSGLKDKLVLRRLAARRLPAAVCGRRKQPFRAPIGSALLGGGSELRDLLDEAALAGDHLIDRAAVGQLLRKAERRGGSLAGEREEMGLVGILTLRLLQTLFGAGFAQRAAEARARLEGAVPHVLVDQSSAAAAPVFRTAAR